jgi:hypothetical protein
MDHHHEIANAVIEFTEQKVQPPFSDIGFKKNSRRTISP